MGTNWPLVPGIEGAVGIDKGAVFVRVKLVWAKTSDTFETANRTAVIAADFIEKEYLVVVNEVKAFETAERNITDLGFLY
jgi:hypothetical protein